MSSACDVLSAQASAGAAAALRAVDCLAGETTASAFGRLFGAQGALAPALTIILTLYIAFFAFSLLTGRATLGVSALTPRMMTLGLVLTFATSWVAYQGVVWNLATGAPDQIAGILMGASGSATQIFADRIDLVFGAISDIAHTTGSSGQVAQGAQGATQGAASGNFTPGNLMWLSALMLLLGTVGVLVTARIALAVLLATGPVFVIFALFPGTRGLTAGWLRGVVLTGVTPLFVIVGGGITLELLVPVVAALGGPQGVDGRASVALFLVCAVHVALMAMMLKVCSTMVSGWRVFGLSERREAPAGRAAAAAPLGYAAAPAETAPAQQAAGSRRAAVLMPAMAAMGESPAGSPPSRAHSRTVRTIVTQGSAPASAPPLPPLARQRARGIGSRFRTPPAAAANRP